MDNLRRNVAHSCGRLSRCERDVRRLQEWVDQYPERFAANVKDSVKEVRERERGREVSVCVKKRL